MAFVVLFAPNFVLRIFGHKPPSTYARMVSKVFALVIVAIAAINVVLLISK